MASRTLRLRGDHRGLYDLFKTLLREANFITLQEEHRGDGFHVIGINRKRTSLLTSTMMSLIGGYIPKKRFAIELFANERDGEVTAELKCKPYINNIDMEATVENQKEMDRCEQLIELFENRILEVLRTHDQGPSI